MDKTAVNEDYASIDSLSEFSYNQVIWLAFITAIREPIKDTEHFLEKYVAAVDMIESLMMSEKDKGYWEKISKKKAEIQSKYVGKPEPFKMFQLAKYKLQLLADEAREVGMKSVSIDL